jgi:hypothetical protein
VIFLKSLSVFIGLFASLFGFILFVIILSQPENDMLSTFFIPSIISAVIGSFVRRAVFMYIAFFISLPLAAHLSLILEFFEYGLSISYEFFLSGFLPILFFISAALMTIHRKMNVSLNE